MARLIGEVRATIGDQDHEDQVIATVHRFGHTLSAHAINDDGRPAEVSGWAIRWGSQLMPQSTLSR